MFSRLRQAMNAADRAEPALPQPGQEVIAPDHALVKVPIVRMIADGDRPQASAGYLGGQPVPLSPSYVPGMGYGRPVETAEQSVRNGWSPVAGHARHLVQNSGFLGGGVEQAVAYTVGGAGLVPNIIPAADELGWEQSFARTWARSLERKFAEWSADELACDAQGRSKFGALQGAAMKGWFETGDVLAVLRFGEKAGSRWKTAIEVIDPVRVATPPPRQPYAIGTVTSGIEYDNDGRPVAVWIRPRPGETGLGTRIPVFGTNGKRLVFHAFDAQAGAVRGISPLGTAIAAIVKTQSLGDAALLSAHVAAMVLGVVTSDLPSDTVLKALGGDDPLGSSMAARVSWHEGLKEQNAHVTLGANGRVVHLASGEKLDLLASKNPFGAFEAMVEQGLREAARALGVTPGMLTGNYRDVSYASGRLALNDMWSITERRRSVLIEPLCQWSLEAVAEELIDRGELPFPKGSHATPLDAFRANRRLACRAEWRGPARPQADDVKAARAAVMRLSAGLSSLTQEVASLGSDFETVAQQKAEEAALLDKLNVKLPWPNGPVAGAAGATGKE